MTWALSHRGFITSHFALGKSSWRASRSKDMGLVGTRQSAVAQDKSTDRATSPVVCSTFTREVLTATEHLAALTSSEHDSFDISSGVNS
eukprot:CAMPEP_0194512896 /NCGR_PEP_ID=MMETSP0253-20130528/45042_1 /TAXON_ID=2966 /ORGANISM="Noctiluca scintillans" /LENGTH=88 /DNA_ID=CAMNT_0039356403 /DNA_START=821 /DNA_END=1087 /DNA_ORIENTATION=+